MRMYTSYNGMRSTGAAVPSGATFSGCVFATTPSLGELTDLPIWIVLREAASRAFLPQPIVEAGRHQAVGALLQLGGAHRERIGVLVLGVVGMTAHPLPLHTVA